MRQRLGIAQALLPNPELIILDEPTDGLDPQGLFEVRSLIRRLRDELGLTIVLSSHLLHEVEQICNRVAIIDGGRLLYQGPTAELIRQHQLVRLKVNRIDEALVLLSSRTELAVRRNGDESLHLEMSDEQIPPIVLLLVENGFEIREVAPERQTLEEVFLSLTLRTPSGSDRVRKA
jgi:ABC-2 type transport system ATP-binding protein